jgi:hypothetical protein
MWRFCFHYRGPDDQVLEDLLGNLHESLESAERETQLVASDILEEELRKGGPVSATRCLEITDERGEIVLYLPFWAPFAIRSSSSGSVILH